MHSCLGTYHYIICNIYLPVATVSYFYTAPATDTIEPSAQPALQRLMDKRQVTDSQVNQQKDILSANNACLDITVSVCVCLKCTSNYFEWHQTLSNECTACLSSPYYTGGYRSVRVKNQFHVDVARVLSIQPVIM